MNVNITYKLNPVPPETVKHMTAHSIHFTARCYAERSYATVSHGRTSPTL